MGMKTGAIFAFGGRTPDRSPNVSRRPSLRPQKSKEITKLEDEDSDAESNALLSQICDLVGNLGVDDPMNSGKTGGSRRGSRVPGKKLELQAAFFIMNGFWLEVL